MSGAAPRPLVLASASPRRRALLEAAGVPFEVMPAHIDEEERPPERPDAFALRLAREKALAIARKLGPSPRRRVLGADTIVVLGEQVLGKPRDVAQAELMLGSLVGRTHRVLTAVAVVTSDDLRCQERVVESRVRMRAASPEEIRSYVATGEPLDKAGAYAVQGMGRRFVEEIIGSETNVIGLPLEESLALLGESR